MSTACAPVRCSGVTRPICQSQRIGWPLRGQVRRVPAAAGARQATGAGSGTTRQRNRIVVAPARLAVRTATWCGPVASVPV